MSRWHFVGWIIFLSGCSNHSAGPSPQPSIHLPPWFPAIEYPEDNQPTPERIELGRRLFYSKELSADNSSSCASCHVSSAAFTDGRVVSTGAHGRSEKRNAPTLANLAWMPHFMMEAGVHNLELPILVSLGDSLEMKKSILTLAEKLNANPRIGDLSQSAYGRPIDVYVITRALACFERTFISGDSRYDRFVFQKKEDQFNEIEKRGMNLFFSDRTFCSDCHKGIFFSDFDYHNIGLNEHDADSGRVRVTFSESDSGKFQTPTLRNCELTAPYMHNGAINTLEEVIEFYNSGGKSHFLKDARIHELQLSKEEKEQLLAFLKCLTDWNFVQNAAFLPLD